MDAYTGEIRLFPYTFAPIDWEWCEGQVLNAQQYAALYSLIGNAYGGSAQQSTFALPDLRGRSVVAASFSGAPPGRTAYAMANTFGASQVISPLATHSHQPKSGYVAGTPLATATANCVVAHSSGNFGFAVQGTGNRVLMAASSLGPATPSMGNVAQGGAADPHSNIQPYLTLHFAICTYGEYPLYP